MCLFLKKILLIALLGNLACQTTAATLPVTESSDCKQISPSIISELSDFTNLIDIVLLDSIVAKHYLFDTHFRIAFEYVQTTNFIQLLDEIQNVPEIRDILNYLQILVPCSNFELYVPQLEIVLLEAIKHEHKNNLRSHRQRRALDIVSTTITTTENSLASSQHTSNVGTFTSFVEEVLDHLPRQRYINEIKDKCEKNSEFKTFYTTLRNSSFRPKVENVLKTTNLAPYLNKLSSHSIDVNSLVPVFFELISWGPNVTIDVNISDKRL